MAQPINKSWVLNGQIVGAPTKDNFSIKEIPYVEAQDGEFLIKNDAFSVDPYLRGQFVNPQTWNRVVTSYTVGTVIQSKNDKFPVGSIVTGILPAQLYVVSKDESLRVVSKEVIGELPLSTLVGALGMPGATAHGAIKEAKAGDVVFINASCGLVGSMLGQLAKTKGAKLVIGTAGGDKKCALAVEKYGYDVCINYKEFTQATEAEKAAALAQRIKEILAAHDAKELNIYFDLVGSWISDAIFQHELICFQGKAIIIGGIDEYNVTAQPVGPRVLTKLIYRAITVKGFIVFAHFGAHFPDYTTEFESEVAPALKNKTLNLDETVVDGFDNISEAFIGLFSGVNTGKMIVKP